LHRAEAEGTVSVRFFYASLARTTRTIYPLYVARKDQDATGYLKLSPVQATVMRVYTQIHAPGAQFAHVPSSCASITRPCTSVSRSTIIDTHVHARESCLIQREGEPRREHRFAAFSHAIHLVPARPIASWKTPEDPSRGSRRSWESHSRTRNRVLHAHEHAPATPAKRRGGNERNVVQKDKDRNKSRDFSGDLRGVNVRVRDAREDTRRSEDH